MEQKLENMKVRRFDALVVGSGCAGYSAADRLWHYGRRNIAVVTDHRLAGTSRNTGSDKQTYYKLTLSGSEPDSVREMAESFFSGQAVDGDHALVEAALSVPCFLRLCDLGVPFPKNRYGEYVGYKTDHDPRARATSVGPLTSKKMTEVLEKAVMAEGIPILDHRLAIAILKDASGRAGALLCLCTDTGGYELLLAGNIVWATGGPAGIYLDSVWPKAHHGMSGVPLEAGAAGRNLTEFQYGLASVDPRWNVSGTYMQALPCFVSTAPDGSDAREFLGDYLTDPGSLLTKIFLKGYQWPFDVRKAADGSSLIDLIVFAESRLKGRRVFLDYTRNPLGDAFSFDLLEKEAYSYLEKTGALLPLPIDRLERMNAPAVEFYRGRGVDLKKERLEIALCAQHCNGGIAVDAWWQSSVPGLFVCGEAAATHGVYRPGGSALNAGQVGAERAALYISKHPGTVPDAEEILRVNRQRIRDLIALPQKAAGETGTEDFLRGIRGEMSTCGAAVRDGNAISLLYEKVREELASFPERIGLSSPAEAEGLYLCRDALLTQQVFLFAMKDYLSRGGESRGSALYTRADGEKGLDALPEIFRMKTDGGRLAGVTQEVRFGINGPESFWRPVRPIPEAEDVFENVWRDYRENENVY